MSQADVIKSLKVKTNGVKRTHKELTMYEKDREKEQAKVDKMKAENADMYDLKQAVRGRG
jgi:tubulin-specific chaperone A